LPERGEVALKMDYNHKTKRASIEGYAVAAGKGFSKKGVRNMYVTEAIMHSDVEDNDRTKVESFFLSSYRRKTENPEEKDRGEPTATVYGKYKQLL
jgi:hypothetical protein